MTPFEIIAEWRKGCSKTCHNKTPADCVECTNAMVNALEKLLQGLDEPMHLLMRLNAWKNHLQGLCQGPSDTWATPEKCAEQLRVRLHSKVRVREEFRSFLEELVDLCAVGDITENSEHEGWAYIVKTAKQFLGRTVVNDDCKSTFYMLGYDAEGKRVATASYSSTDPQRDARITNAALELAQAVLLRGVDITPEQLYRHVVGRNYTAPGTAPGHPLPDWPEDLTTFAERKAYQRGVADARSQPLDMVLHCPNCGEQHIDAPEGERDLAVARIDEDSPEPSLWTNPPHRSHLCAHCGHTWRPADVKTNGVKAVKTAGKKDSPIAQTSTLAQAWAAACAYIDASVGDPDVTVDSYKKFKEFERLRGVLTK